MDGARQTDASMRSLTSKIEPTGKVQRQHLYASRMSIRVQKRHLEAGLVKQGLQIYTSRADIPTHNQHTMTAGSPPV